MYIWPDSALSVPLNHNTTKLDQSSITCLYILKQLPNLPLDKCLAINKTQRKYGDCFMPWDNSIYVNCYLIIISMYRVVDKTPGMKVNSRGMVKPWTIAKVYLMLMYLDQAVKPWSNWFMATLKAMKISSWKGGKMFDTCNQWARVNETKHDVGG